MGKNLKKTKKVRPYKTSKEVKGVFFKLTICWYDMYILYIQYHNIELTCGPHHSWCVGFFGPGTSGIWHDSLWKGEKRKDCEGVDLKKEIRRIKRTKFKTTNRPNTAPIIRTCRSLIAGMNGNHRKSMKLMHCCIVYKSTVIVSVWELVSRL